VQRQVPALEVLEVEGLGGLGGVEDHADPFVGGVDGAGVVLEAHDDEAGGLGGAGVVEAEVALDVGGGAQAEEGRSCGGWPRSRGSGRRPRGSAGGRP
jgi:hypothetical protein